MHYFAIVNRAKDSDPEMAWEVCATIRSGEIAVFDKAYVDSDGLQNGNNLSVELYTLAKEMLRYRRIKYSFFTNRE